MKTFLNEISESTSRKNNSEILKGDGEEIFNKKCLRSFQINVKMRCRRPLQKKS